MSVEKNMLINAAKEKYEMVDAGMYSYEMALYFRWSKNGCGVNTNQVGLTTQSTRNLRHQDFALRSRQTNLPYLMNCSLERFAILSCPQATQDWAGIAKKTTSL